MPKSLWSAKKLLAMAKAAEIKGLGFFVILANDTVRTHWLPGCASAAFMAAGASWLNHRVLAASDASGTLTTDRAD